MTAVNRLGEEWLIGYAAGTLSEGQSVMVASYASLNDEARRDLRAAEDMAGAMLDGLEPDALAPEALARTLALLGDVEPVPMPAAPGEKGEPEMPGPLYDYVGRRLGDLDWSFLGPGMQKVRLWTGEGDERLWLLKAKPGVTIPKHGHRGEELVLVLKGGFSDGTNHFERGDIQSQHEEDMHSLRIDDGEECICLALTRGRLRFDSWPARIVQIFVGL